MSHEPNTGNFFFMCKAPLQKRMGTMSQESILVVLSTAGPVIGSAIGVWRKPSELYIHNMLYFAAGIMLSISFLNLIPESISLASTITCVAGATIGSSIMAFLDRLFPHLHDCAVCAEDECRLGRTANFLILAIFLHNFPEGMAIAVGAAANIGDSVVIALAIAIHNIPEGICTSAPHYYAYGNRFKSFAMSSISAVPIVLGYLAVKFIVGQISSFTMSIMVGATAGLMIYITADELMPAARNASGKQSIFSFIAGIIAVMLLGLVA
jgi:zinc transporter, ZIP family